MTTFLVNTISNDYVHDVQCCYGGHEDAISPSFAGAHSRASDS